MEMKGLNEYNFTFLYSFKANNVMLMILDLASFFVKKLGNKKATTSKFHDVWQQNPESKAVHQLHFLHYSCFSYRSILIHLPRLAETEQ
jgi:hypothetical protein